MYTDAPCQTRPLVKDRSFKVDSSVSLALEEEHVTRFVSIFVSSENFFFQQAGDSVAAPSLGPDVPFRQLLIGCCVQYKGRAENGT